MSWLRKKSVGGQGYIIWKLMRRYILRQKLHPTFQHVTKQDLSQSIKSWHKTLGIQNSNAATEVEGVEDQSDHWRRRKWNDIQVETYFLPIFFPSWIFYLVTAQTIYAWNSTFRFIHPTQFIEITHLSTEVTCGKSLFLHNSLSVSYKR